MSVPRVFTANAYESTLTSGVSGSDLTFNVVSTSGAPASPCFLVVDPSDPAKREYIFFDGTFTGTSFSTTTTDNRHLAGSAGSSISHSSGAIVRSASVSQLFENLNDRIDLAIPAGIITGWSGSVGSVPSGWALCDGTLGTPDLRNRFIVGAGGDYAVGATGGAANVALTTAQMPSHSHSGNSGSAGAHSHGSGNLNVSSHSHGSGNLNASSHSHNSGNLFGGSHSHASGNLNSGSTNINHSHGIALRGTGSTNHAHDALNVSAGAGFASVGWNQNSNTNSGATNVNHSHNVSGNVAASGVGIGGSTAASSPGVSGNTTASSPGLSGNTTSVAAHGHSVSIGNAGSGNAHENRPPYYALAFIMKL